jgi:hypothetical protein
LSLKIVTIDIVGGNGCEIDGIFEPGFLCGAFNAKIIKSMNAT